MDKEAIKALRVALNMTQSEFARILEVDVCTISRWERGRRIPQPGHIKRMEEQRDKLLSLADA